MFTSTTSPNLLANLGDDLRMFMPEVLVVLGIVVMLLLRLLPRFRMHMGVIALIFSGFALLLAVGSWWDISAAAEPGQPTLLSLNLMGQLDPKVRTFAGLIVVDHFTAFMRMLLLGFAMLLTWLAMVTGIPDEEDS